MELNLKKPICFFDLETTGINISKDRIVEISILKIFPNGNKESKTWLVNPEMPIPPETTEVHGITNEKVANEPTFKQLANKISDMIKGCDLGGFNSNRFDIPLLAEELLRVDLDFDMKNTVAVDVQTIFHKMEKRTLGAAYMYIKFLADFSSRKQFADFAGFIAFDKEGREVFSFGKHKGKLVEKVMDDEPGYFGWLQNADFPLYTKKVLTAVRLRKLNNSLKL